MTAATKTEKTVPRDSLRTLPVLAAALGAGILLRLIYLSQVRGNPFFEYPIIDGREYLAWAHRILGGEFLWREVPIHGPAYPFLLAGLLGISGGSLVFAIFAQMMLGVAGAFLVHRIARKFFGPPVAAIAAILSATYLTFIYFEGLILASALVLFINLLVLERLAYLPPQPRPAHTLIPGALLGLSIATHPSAFLLVPLLGAWLALERRRGRSRSRSGGGGGRASAAPTAGLWPRLQPAALLVAGALVVVAPIALRNASLGGGAVLQRNVGKAFYIGLGPTADGTANVPPGTPWERLRRQAWDAGARSAAEETRYFLSEALGFAARNPAEAIGLLARKAYLFVSGIHVDASQDHRFYRDGAPLLRLPLPTAAVVIPLALFGLIHAGRRAPLLLAYLAAYLLSTMAFAFSTRYALPAHPVFVIFAAVALIELGRAARARKIGANQLALLAVALVVSNLDLFDLRDRRLLHTEGFVAKVVLESGRVQQGVELQAGAVQRYPGDADIHNAWGTTLDRIGRRDEAREQYRLALEAAPDNFEARFNLAAQAHESGNASEAIEGYRAAMRSAPWRADARLNLGVAYADLDSLDLAAAQFDTALALAPDFTEVTLNLAKIERRRQNPGRAAELYSRVLIDEPTADVALELAMALSEAGDHLGSQRALRQGLRIDPDHKGCLFQLGMNLAGFQSFEEAIATWERLLELDPDNDLARAAIAQARARIAAADSAGAGAAADAETETEGAAPPPKPGAGGPDAAR